MISITFMQYRGEDKFCVAQLFSSVVPRQGEAVCIAGTEIKGCVRDVTYSYVAKSNAPRVLDCVTVTLDGWKHR